jgi:hypothetical protein
MIALRMTRRADERTRQVAAAAGILLGLAAIICASLLGWRLIPGVIGEWLGMVIGVMTTPFFMEASFGLLGLALVVMLNHWRQSKAGEELVYLEQVDEAAGLPEHAAWAVFRNTPLEVELPTRLEQLQGAMAIRDHHAAAEMLAGMNEEELRQPETLALRLELARASGLHDLARQLETQARAADGKRAN